MEGIVGAGFNVFVGLVLPMGIFLFILARRRYLTPSFLCGVLTFLVFQLLTRIPLLTYVLGRDVGFLAYQARHPVSYILLLSVSAAVFEELGRYVVMELLMKKRRAWVDGVAFGLGHGGLEAMIVGMQNLQLLVLNTSWLTNAGLAEVIPAGIERILALIVQVCLSLFVMKSLRDKKPLWLLISIGLHTVANATSALMAHGGASALRIELVFGLFALGMLVTALLLYRQDRRGKREQEGLAP